jgi:hypothetical protein
MSSRAPHRRDRRPISAPDASVQLHIEELILHGVAPGDAARLTAALQAELGRCAARPGQVFVPANAERASPIDFTPGRGPEATGRALASAVWIGVLQAGKG